MTHIIICQWFARCANATTKAAKHPVLGPVPICDRCAEKLDITPEYEIQRGE